MMWPLTKQEIYSLENTDLQQIWQRFFIQGAPLPLMFLPNFSAISLVSIKRKPINTFSHKKTFLKFSATLPFSNLFLNCTLRARHLFMTLMVHPLA